MTTAGRQTSGDLRPRTGLRLWVQAPRAPALYRMRADVELPDTRWQVKLFRFNPEPERAGAAPAGSAAP